MAGKVEVNKNGFAEDRARFQLKNVTLNKFDFTKIYPDIIIHDFNAIGCHKQSNFWMIHLHFWMIQTFSDNITW